MARDYVGEYINFIEENDIPVGKKLKAAIDRHLSDLEKSKNDDYPYKYVPELAHKPVLFIGLMPDPKTRKPNELEFFQKFIIGMIYGWVTKDGEYRRFRKAYISLARKNGKSLLVSGIALYDFLFGKYPAASRQVYSTANKLDQAKIVFNMVKTQLKAIRGASPGVSKFTKVKNNELLTNDESVMKPLASDSTTLDGLDVYTAVIDEYAEAKDSSIIDVIQSSQAQQKEPLVVIISTASSNLNGVMHTEEYSFVEKLLNKEVENEEYLALCWELDNLGEAYNEELWIKANPLLSSDEVRDTMLKHKRTTFDEARGKSNLSNWLTKEMNLWVKSAKDSFLSKNEWVSVASETKYDLRSRQVYIGLDIARTGDITAVSWIIPINEEGKLLIDTHGFISSRGGIQEKQERDKIPYVQYEKMGIVNISSRDDGLIDIDDMCDWIRDFVDKYDLEVMGIYYDPAMMNQALINLGDDFVGLLTEVPQRVSHLSSPTKAFKEKVLRGEIVHLNNPLMTRAVYNAVIKEANDTIVIDKKYNRNKIDPVDAVINAMYEAQYHDFEAVSIQEMYESGTYGFGI